MITGSPSGAVDGGTDDAVAEVEAVDAGDETVVDTAGGVDGEVGPAVVAVDVTIELADVPKVTPTDGDDEGSSLQPAAVATQTSIVAHHLVAHVLDVAIV